MVALVAQAALVAPARTAVQVVLVAPVDRPRAPVATVVPVVSAVTGQQVWPASMEPSRAKTVVQVPTVPRVVLAARVVLVASATRATTVTAALVVSVDPVARAAQVVKARRVPMPLPSCPRALVATVPLVATVEPAARAGREARVPGQEPMVSAETVVTVATPGCPVTVVQAEPVVSRSRQVVPVESAASPALQESAVSVGQGRRRVQRVLLARR
jgi:hypothetical protein